MEIGEDAKADRVAANKHDESCYFCKSKAPPAKATNVCTDARDEDVDLDGPATGKFKNDAGKLGGNLGNQVEATVTVNGKTRPVHTAAHHLIPGNASLKRSDLFDSEFLWTDGEAQGNIGYDVNAKANGVWSPGNYAVRPWKTKTPEFQKEYAFEAMRVLGTQFHDAHSAYSGFVIEVLNKITDKLRRGGELWCPEVKKRKKQKKEDRPPLKVLVSRLHTVSGRMRGMLTGGPIAWKRNIWTSRYALQLMQQEHPRLRALEAARKKRARRKK